MTFLQKALFVTVSMPALATAIEPQVKRWVQERRQRELEGRGGEIVITGAPR